MSSIRDINTVDFVNVLEHNNDDSIMAVNSIAVRPVKSVTVLLF